MELPPPGKGSPPPHGGVPRRPAAGALLAIGAIYLLVPTRLAVGPRGLLLAVLAILLVPLGLARRRGYRRLTRGLALGLTGLVTLAVVTSAALLLVQLPGGRTPAPLLLRDAALIWVVNVLVFALWYWEIDGGGPAERHTRYHRSTDFQFPQLSADGAAERWSPTFVDYLFLAFNTSTAFSPTDTVPLSRPVKLLMMAQSLISLIVTAVLAARAINTL